MAIIVSLDAILLQKKIKLQTLSDEVGITMANLSILKTGKAKAIRFSTLENICKYLQCQPGDILKYAHDEIKIHDSK